MTSLRNYTRSFLLGMQQTTVQQRPRIPLQVLLTLRAYEICSVPRTHRRQPARKIGVGAIHSNLLQISTTTSVKTSGLTVGCLNVQSARNKADLIRDIVISHDIDILSLTETWLTTKDKDDFHVKGLSLPGYEFNHTPRHGYGGVGSIHKASMKIIKTDVYKSNSFENMQIKFNTGSRCLDLITLYRPPPNQNNKLTTSQFFEEFSTFPQDKVTGSGDLMMVGDLNFHIDKKADNTTQKFTDMLGSLGIEQRVNKPTHMSGHILDVIMCRDTDNPVMQRSPPQVTPSEDRNNNQGLSLH